MAAGCLFSSDTIGLSCTKTSHCQEGEVCKDGKCAKGSGNDTGDSDTDTDGGSGSGSGSSGTSG
jgi:hypothetical protein